MLEKHGKNECYKKMKEQLNVSIELTQKYIDLDEYKKYFCIELDSMFPEPHCLIIDEDSKTLNGEEENQEKVKMFKSRKKRRYYNSFFCADNLVQWNESNKGAKVADKLLPQSIFWFKSIIFDFE
jgi:hypothetical protein